MKTVRRFIDWLGQGRALALFLLIAVTGTLSLMLQAIGPDVGWVIPVQNGLLLIALLGPVGVVISRVDPMMRRPVLISIAPLILGLAIGVLFPQFLLWFVGAGLGWLFVSQLILRRNVRREYQQAIRHLRNNEYDEAIEVLNQLVKAEPDNTDHLHFRADLFRLRGDFARAIKDYRRIVRLEPENGVGYNGLAEVHLQQGDYALALEQAQEAYRLEPDQWVMPYNLGMIEDRLGMWAEARQHLQETQAVGVADSRHRLLIALWIARACTHLGEVEAARQAVQTMRKEQAGLKEWATIFESEQARTLRQVLLHDVELAQRIFDGAEPSVLLADPAATPEEA